MVAQVHKNTNAPMILILCDVICRILAKHIIVKFSMFFEGTLSFLFPKKSFAALRPIGGSKSVGARGVPMILPGGMRIFG